MSQDFKLYNACNTNTIFDTRDYYLKREVDMFVQNQDLYTIMRLLGSVSPVGETREDERRLDNLKKMLHVTQGLIDAIVEVADLRTRYESSIKQAGNLSQSFLLELQDQLNERLKEE